MGIEKQRFRGPSIGAEIVGVNAELVYEIHSNFETWARCPGVVSEE